MELGLDMSTSCCGYALFDNGKLIHCNKITPNGVDWRERVSNLSIELINIIQSNDVTKIVSEDVPLIGKQSSVLVMLGACQGMLIAISKLYDIPISLVPVGQWRKNIGISTGDRDRDSMKIKSIQKCNELFGTDYEIHYTKSGNYKSEWDDITDSVLIYASTLDEYKVQPIKKSFGKGAK